MAVLCHLDTCRFFGSGKCEHTRKKENGGKFILPTFRPGKPCIWGKPKFDAADYIRAQIAIEEVKTMVSNEMIFVVEGSKCSTCSGTEAKLPKQYGGWE